MGFAIRIALYAVAGLLLIGAIWFFYQALLARVLATKQAYGVARQAERLKMMQASFWGVGLIIFALIFTAVASLTMWSDSPTAEPPPEPTSVIADPEPTSETAVTPPEEAELPTAEPTPTATLPPPIAPSTEERVTPEGSETAEPVLPTAEPTTSGLPVAYIDSPVVGLYLRVAPGGEIIERLEDRAVVTLLGESQTVDGLEWVRVTAVSGNQGWVANDFLVPGQPPVE